MQETLTADRWQVLKGMFEKALDAPASQRDEVLAQAQAEDEDLARWLDTILRHHETASSLFAGPIISRERMLEYAAAGVRTFQPGEIIAGRFRIEQFIGEGGMGEVYAARDLDLGERIAVKTLRPILSVEPELLRMFKQEIQITRRVTHENVGRVFDLFWHEILNCEQPRRVAFLTMELLEGETLAERIRRLGPLWEEDALPLVDQISLGLMKAHECGIVHRDFKSGNVIVTGGPGQPPRAVITDFGLAVLQASRYGEDGAKEVSGGTPTYMAPEQAAGEPVTTAADIYAMGVVLFEMVTGRVPFAGTAEEIARQKLAGSAPSPRAHAPHLDARWQTTIRACLQRDPDLRPADPRAVVRMLRSRRVVAIRTLVACVAVIAVLLALYARLQPAPFTLEAVKSFRRGEDFAQQRSESGMKNAVLEFRRAVKLEPRYSEAWVGLAEAYSGMANFELMDPQEGIRQARAAAEQALSINPHPARAVGVLGYVISIDVHHWLDAEQYLRRAVEEDRTDPEIRLWYGAYLGKEGKSAEAIEQLNEGLNEDPSSFLLNQQLATEYFRAHQFASYSQQAKELVRLKPFEATSYVALARAAEWTGQFDQALRAADDVAKYGDPEVAACVRGLVEAARGNRGKAERIAQHVYAYWQSKPFEANLTASLFARIGRDERAVEILNQGFDRGDSTVLNAPTSPYFDELRTNKTFEQFLSRIGWKPVRR